MIDIDIDEDDLRAIHSPARICDTISHEDIRLSKSLPLLISYDLLYTDESGKANRQTGARSPRVFFMTGQYGIIHILFFDPFHEILK